METTDRQTDRLTEPVDDPWARDGFTEIESPIVEVEGREMYEHFRFVADKGQQLLRVDKFLVDRLIKTSRNRIQQAAEAG